MFFEGDAIGTESKNRAWMSEEERNLSMREGGVSLLDWTEIGDTLVQFCGNQDRYFK